MLLALAAMMNRLHGLTRWPHRQRHVLVRQLGSLSAEREECEDLVIGAGVVGICTAYSLARQGRRVKVLDQGSGPAQGSSWINGTLICPSLMLPWTGPQLIPKVFKSFYQQGHPLKVHPRALLSSDTYFFGLHYLASCRPGHGKRTTRRLANLARYSRHCLEALLRSHQELNGYMDRKAKGTLQVFEDKAAMQACLDASEQIQHAGVPLNVVRDENMEGAGDNLTERLRRQGLEALYLYSPLDTNGDCAKFTHFLERQCQELGVGFEYDSSVQGFQKNSGLWEVVLPEQKPIRARNVILCAGVGSPRLAAMLGLRLPMAPVKGYAITVPLKPGVQQLSSNVVQDSSKLYLAPLGPDLVRITGFAEFAGFDSSVDLDRATILAAQAEKLLPDCLDWDRAEYHTGLRPLSADDVPIIGEAKPNFFLNTGHGSKGWTHAAGSGQLVADLIAGREPYLDPERDADGGRALQRSREDSNREERDGAALQGRSEVRRLGVHFVTCASARAAPGHVHTGSSSCQRDWATNRLRGAGDTGTEIRTASPLPGEDVKDGRLLEIVTFSEAPRARICEVEDYLQLEHILAGYRGEHGEQLQILVANKNHPDTSNPDGFVQQEEQDQEEVESVQSADAENASDMEAEEDDDRMGEELAPEKDPTEAEASTEADGRCQEDRNEVNVEVQADMVEGMEDFTGAQIISSAEPASVQSDVQPEQESLVEKVFFSPAAINVLSAPSVSASSRGLLDSGTVVSGCLKSGWLKLDEESKEQLLLGGEAEAWISVESLVEKEARTTEDETNGREHSSRQAEKLLGQGIEYRAMREFQCYPSPSELGENMHGMAINQQGEALLGYPSHQHWIRLVASETNTEFISHWVFQDPGSPALEASWSRLKVSQTPSACGVLHLSWPGLAVSPLSTVYYALEWTKRGADIALGCGLTPRPECTLVTCPADAQFRISAFVNGQERSLHITSPWQSDFVVEQPPEPPEPPEEVQMSETAEAQDAQLPSAEVPVTSPDAAEAAEAVEDEAACPKETKSVAPAEKISTSSDAATEPAEGSHERSDTGDEAKTMQPGQSSCFEVVHRGGVFLREGRSSESASKGRLAFGQRVFGVLSGEWLQVEKDSQKEAVEGPMYVLVDGKDWGLGALLEEVPLEVPAEAAEAEAVEVEAAQATEPLGSEPQRPEPEPQGEASPGMPSSETKKAGPAQKARQAAIRRAAMVAEEVLAKPVEYVVVAETPAYCEPAPQALSAGGSFRPGQTVTGFPGNASWIRVASVDAGGERWAPIKSAGSAKEVLLSPAWAQLQAEEVFSEALVVSWPGLAAPKPPYVAAYSIEWRLTPGEELPIGAGDGEDFKKSGYALSLQPRATLHGLPPGAAVQLRAGVRVAAQSAGQADFRLMGPWQDFTTGSPLTEEEEAEPARSIDPFGAARGGCESSQCRGYVADLDAMASVGANANFLVHKAICVRCGKSFEAHERIEASVSASRRGRAAKVQVAKLPEPNSGGPPEDDESLRTFEVVHAMVFVRDRASVKGRTLGVLKSGERVRGWRRSGWLQLSRTSSLDVSKEIRDWEQLGDSWILIHGAEVGLGQLMQEVNETAVEVGRGAQGPKQVVPAGQMASMEQAARDTRSVLEGPIQFSVVGSADLPIRAKPSSEEAQVGALKPGAAVLGYPVGEWMKIEASTTSQWDSCFQLFATRRPEKVARTSLSDWYRSHLGQWRSVKSAAFSLEPMEDGELIVDTEGPGRQRKSEDSLSLDTSDRFQELLQELLSEHRLRVSELREANQQLHQEICEHHMRPCSEDAGEPSVPKEFWSHEITTPPPSTGAGSPDSHRRNQRKVPTNMSLLPHDLEASDALSAASRVRTSRDPQGFRRAKTDIDALMQATDSNHDGFHLKAVWTDYLDTNNDIGSGFQHYFAAMKEARMDRDSGQRAPTSPLRLMRGSRRELMNLANVASEERWRRGLAIVAKQCKPGIISPSGTYRMFWDLLGLLLILYDTVTIPLQVFEISRDQWSVTMDWVTLFFWTLDMFQSFFTGYFQEGVKVMDPRRIVRNYLKSWFWLDLLVVGPEWFTSMSPDAFGLDGVGIGRILRLGRAMRVLRLLRLFKLRRIVDALLELVESEYAFTIINLLKLLFAVLVLNHVIACVWYLVGKTAANMGQYSWFEMSGHYPNDSIYMYFTSLHWSLTQFTPASMNVSAANTMERIMSICVLFFAMVAFSSIVGHITASMSHLQNLRGAQMKQFWMLRRYLKQRCIRRDLQLRITKFLEYKTQKEHDLVHSSSVVILDQLSEPLRKELSYEIMIQWLMSHPFFEVLSSKMPVIMHRLCHLALTEIALASSDVVFTAGHEGKQMLFVKHGELEYMRLGREVLDPPLLQKDWFVEAALWVSWRHMGDCRVLSPGELIAISNDVFAKEMRLHHLPWSFCKMYAIRFCEKLNAIEPKDLSDVLREETMLTNVTVHEATEDIFNDADTGEMQQLAASKAT
eukprot:s2320_g14.t2